MSSAKCSGTAQGAKPAGSGFFRARFLGGNVPGRVADCGEERCEALQALGCRPTGASAISAFQNALLSLKFEGSLIRQLPHFCQSFHQLPDPDNRSSGIRFLPKLPCGGCIMRQPTACFCR
jgi:hypothetical protein